jgi:hypothetical protein
MTSCASSSASRSCVAPDQAVGEVLHEARPLDTGELADGHHDGDALLDHDIGQEGTGGALERQVLMAAAEDVYRQALPGPAIAAGAQAPLDVRGIQDGHRHAGPDRLLDDTLRGVRLA